MNKWFVIINPVSGGGKVVERWRRVEKILREKNIPFETATTTYKGEAEKLIQTVLIENNFRHIIGVGGDGTNNEIINGIFAQTQIPPAEIFYTMYASGTGNDWARMHALPTQPKKFVAMLQNLKTSLQDIGVVDFTNNVGIETRRYFANAGGAGYDAFVVEKVESVKKFPLGKKASYLFYVLKCIFSYKAPTIQVAFDDEKIERKFYTVNYGINKFSGGGMQMTPHADNADGLLAITLLDDIPSWKVLSYTPHLFLGTVAKVREGHLYQTEKIKIESNNNRNLFFETDGELIGNLPVEISVLQKVLRVVVVG